MKKTRFTNEQIAFALRQAETGTQVAEVCRKMGISEALSSILGTDASSLLMEWRGLLLKRIQHLTKAQFETRRPVSGLRHYQKIVVPLYQKIFREGNKSYYDFTCRPGRIYCSLIKSHSMICCDF